MTNDGMMAQIQSGISVPRSEQAAAMARELREMWGDLESMRLTLRDGFAQDDIDWIEEQIAANDMCATSEDVLDALRRGA